MDDFMLQDPHFQDDWPAECFDKYERVHILGKGSFGMVWMSHRLQPAEDEFDDEFVAIKAIMIKNEKSKVYAEREIRILQELRHPNVIRLIRAYPIYNDTRAVVMQLAQGPNLNQLVVKRGALGLPLCRMVARQLIAAVGYGTYLQIEFDESVIPTSNSPWPLTRRVRSARKGSYSPRCEAK
jgi:serine/threonine protein kinase